MMTRPVEQQLKYIATSRFVYDKSLVHFRTEIAVRTFFDSVPLGEPFTNALVVLQQPEHPGLQDLLMDLTFTVNQECVLEFRGWSSIWRGWP